MPPTPPGHGRPRLLALDRLGRVAATAEASNTWTYLAGHVLALAVRGLPGGVLNGAYVEYENVADPEEAVAVPAEPPRDEGLAYYAALGATPARDYVRAPLAGPPAPGVEPGYEPYFAAGQGNRLVYPARVAEGAGVHGRPFTAAARSKVCGVALVAIPAWEDPAADLVFARAYFPADRQLVVPAGGMLALDYPIYFS